MFWRFGGYAAVSTIDTILDKPDVTLEELLDESDLIQELKQHNTKLIEYLREDRILEKLLEYVVAPKPEKPVLEAPEAEEEERPELKGKSRSISRPREEDAEDEKEKRRNRYSYVAAEVLSSDNWSICEALLENQVLLRKFWEFMKLPTPLDPLQASYFTKVNEALLDKKTEEMLDLFKSLDSAVNDMLQHVDSPMVMDLLLKIISLDKQDGGAGIVDWLHAQDLMPILLSFLSSEHSWATQTSAGDFLKAIITISANASQNEQSCIGPNALTRQLVSQPCIEKLISDMLKGGNPLTVGVGIIIEVIRKNNSDYDPDVGAEPNAVPSSKDPIYLGTLLRMFAQRVPDFMDLILSPNHTVGGGDGPVSIKRKELSAAFGGKIEPLGFDRFKTCELMAELLHCSNMGLLNEIGSEEFVKARDMERERLKAEGKLAVAQNQATSSEDDLTMKSSTQTRLGSPDGLRKLEVQNASDDDGFEEVSRDLGDDNKDDFEERPEDFIGPTETDLPKSTAPLSFLDKDDEEFVDEPLSSPRLNNIEPTQLPHSEEDDLTPLPLSPTKDLSNKIDILDFKEEDTTMTSTPPSFDSHTDGSEESTSDKPLPDSEESVPSSPRPGGKVEETVLTQAILAPEALESLSHPEDKPAPLFAKKSEPTVESTSEVATPEQNSSSETFDTTMGEAGDISNSVLIGNADDLRQSTIEEPITPVVGDYLKMQFVEHKVVPTILDFFFRFPWNNFLHNVVYDVVQQVFNGPMDRGFNRSLAIDLFETGDITMRIVDGQKKSDEAQEKHRMRLGYMGHLTLIAEEVVKFTERHPPELLSDSVLEKVMNGEWITYVEVTLAETRERDNAILGGVRPDMSVGPRQAVMNTVNAGNNFGGASSALIEAGLNGAGGLDSIDLANGNGVTGSAFTLSGGTLLSGFGSSSDEEDDEMDEDNEDDGTKNSIGAAEFSRYISTPSTTTATSSDLEPPSAPPPPPPPLNIPPSRARRQLAARLALHSKQNAEANLETSEAEKEHRKNLNPFATEEDDDSDDEHKDFTIGDLEVEEEGRGHLPAGTGLVGKHEPLLGGDGSQEKNVGIEHLAANSSSTSSVDTGSLWNGSSAGSSSDRRSRTKFPLLWAFGAKMEGLDWNRHQSKGASKTHADHYQFQSSDSDSDEDTNDFGREGQACRGKRRLSVTTEAKRRTSLEDEDEDDEVVHVALAEAAEELRWDVGGVAHVQRKEKSDTEGEADDGEMVDHHHAE